MKFIFIYLSLFMAIPCFSEVEKHLECRDLILQTQIDKKHWSSYGSWGPPATTYPKMMIPEEEKAYWVIEVAKHFIGTPYKHKHIPSLGIDCSNFTSFVFNYALSIKLISSVEKQAESVKHKIYDLKKLKKGDLLFFKRPDRKRVSHVAIYIDENTLIDSTSSKKTGGVAIREFKGWYKKQFVFGGRIIK